MIKFVCSQPGLLLFSLDTFLDPATNHDIGQFVKIISPVEYLVLVNIPPLPP